MRIKLNLSAPFTPSKILLPVPETVKTITHLKKHLHKSLSSISRHAAGYKELKVDIDGFELLGGSEIDVIQDGDVVTVGLYPESSTAKSIKRERSASSALAVKDTHSMTGTKKRKLEDESRAASRSTDLERDHQKAKKTRSDIVNGPSTSLIAAKTSKDNGDHGDAQVGKRKTASLEHRGSAIPSVAIPQSARRLSSSSISSSPSSSSSSSSSSASSSSVSSSSISSSSSEASSSSSSASSDSATPPSGSKTNILPKYPVSLNPQPLQSVPPGQGKDATRLRNARRRKAREYKKAADQSLTQTQSDDTAQMSARHQPDLGQTSFTNPEIVTSAMSNRNKKKGFLKEMMAIRGLKTVFGGDPVSGMHTPDDVSQDQIITSTPAVEQRQHGVSMSGSPSVHTPQANGSTRRNRLIPPSEMDDLPSNVFVSSMEYKTPRRPISSKGRRWEPNGHLDGDEGAAQMDEGSGEEAQPTSTEIPTTSATSMAMDQLEEAVTPGQSLLWTKVEVAFDAFEDLTKEAVRSLGVGSLIAWKDIELDLSTFTPELKTQIASITAVSAEVISLEKLRRPVVYLDGEENEAVEVTEQVEEDGEAVISLEELDSNLGRWKVVPAGMA